MFNHYLTAMQGKSAQDPIKAIDLLQKNQSESALLADLDQMYQRGMINRASVTRNGQTNLVVWPTGVSKPYNAKTDFKISPPKRDEIVNKPTAAAEPTQTEKPTSLLTIAQFVHNKQKVTKDEIYKNFPTPAGRKSDYVYKLIWQLNKEGIINVQKAELAKNDVVTIGSQYENYLAKLQKKQPKGPVINMPTADEYALPTGLSDYTDLVPKKLKELPDNLRAINPIAKPSIESCVQIIQSHLPAQTSMRIKNNEDIEIYAPVLAKPILIDIKNITQAMQTLKKLNEIAVPAF